MVDTMRVVVGVLGALMIVGGIAGFAIGAWPGGLWSMVIGAVAIVAVALERTRYQSAAAERSAGERGPGGGELRMPVAPFRATDELFVDPTSGHLLRVYLDPATGERRYYAEEARPGA
ncbi:MAG: hypothetical protein ABI458_06220 [Chloroflexota bacterium]